MHCLLILIATTVVLGQHPTITTTANTTLFSNPIPTPTTPIISSTTFASITSNSIQPLPLPTLVSVNLSILSFSASPTTSVLTHFPTPTKQASSSSVLSSLARPSQSAPLPDDTVGKYGRLHVSAASRTTQHSILCLIAIVFLLTAT
ncbi:hypothetical protein CLU79DRAFT_729570 [Phycomyces nitens]|nr:hypothetical protein CLU79DRAFT_729570 [Phycomyces nitens]